MKGVLIFEGMRVGILAGDLTVRVSENGAVESHAVLSTAYNVIPVWLRAAVEHLKAARDASNRIQQYWSTDEPANKELDPYWSQVFQRNNSSVPATQLPFIETGNDSLRSAALQEIRIVKGSHVRVRRGWRRRSPTFSSLEPGQVVLLVQKHRQNALVGFYNETQGFCGVGWVKAKYLKRVSLR